MEVLAMHVRTPVPPMVGIPDRVAQVVMRALAKEPSNRQQNAEQLQNEAQQVSNEMGGAGAGMGGMSGAMPVQQPPQMHAQAKTVFAGASPGPSALAHDPARTVIAGSGMGMGMPPNPMMPMSPQNAPAHTPTTPQGNARHMMGDSAQQAAVRQSGQVGTRPRPKKKKQNSAAVFWMLCIIAGILIGIVAYLIVSNVVH
jgi:hypothetical protein